MKKKFWKAFISGYLLSMMILIAGGLLLTTYLIGLVQGSVVGYQKAENGFLATLEKIVLSQEEVVKQAPTQIVYRQSPSTLTNNLLDVDWGGPELWQAVNGKRKEYGVNELTNESKLCTIASIRLNELLELGRLDGHEGFSNLAERRPDLKYIFDSYSTVSEFLVSGAKTPSEAVSLWDNTLGHKKLLTGGEYVWGCIYAQNGMGVAITSY